MAVYFVLDASAGLVKIGHSKDPDARFSELCTGNGSHLEMIGWVPGGRKEELALHRAFAPFRTRREWFRVYPAGLELIRAICEEAERRELLDMLERSCAAIGV